MVKKPTREELEQKIAQLEAELKILKSRTQDNTPTPPPRRIQNSRKTETMEHSSEEREKALRISQEQLLRSREQLQLVTDALPVFIAYVDNQYRYRFANAYYEKIFGVKKEMVMGGSIMNILGLDGFQKAKPHIEKVLTGERQEFSFNYCLTSGEKRYFHSIYIPHIIKGTVDGFFILSRDLTEETLAREALEDSEARFESVINSMTDIVFTLDRHQRHTGIYGDWTRQFGGSPDMLLGKNAAEIFGEEDSLAHQEANDKVLKGERVTYEWMMTIPDGEKKIFQTSLSPLKDRRGDIVGITGVGRDITDRIRFEVELEIAKNKAENASKAKSEFLANMSHEIRTPLNAVTGFSELLSTMVSDPRQRSYLQSIKTAGKSLMQLLDDILDLSKIEAGMMDIQLTPVNLPALIREIGQIFEPSMAQKDLLWETEWDECLPETLMLDEIRVRQILLNLTGNAVKFTQRGSIRIITRRIRRFRERWGFGVIISVRDTGIGIPTYQRQNIFESFHQHSPHIHRQYGGSGLGLTISKRLAELMKGRLTVKSTEGKGSTFSLILPDVSAAPFQAEKKPDAPKGDFQFQPVKVLVADNDEVNRALLRALLEPVNIEVLEARDGQEALEIAAKTPLAAILMDLRMPVLDGWEAARQIRLAHSRQPVPIIAVTASPTPARFQNNGQITFDACLYKPISSDLLFKYLRRILPLLETPSTTPHHPAVGADTLTPLQSPAVLNDLTHTVLPNIKKLSIGMKMSDARELAKTLLSLGDRHKIPFLITCGEQLEHASRIFDINGIKQTLKELQETIQMISSGAKKRNEKKRTPGDSHR